MKEYITCLMFLLAGAAMAQQKNSSAKDVVEKGGKGDIILGRQMQKAELGKPAEMLGSKTAQNAAEKVLTLFINNKKVAQKVFTGEPFVIHIEKLKITGASSAKIFLQEKSVNSIYKKSIELTDEQEHHLYQAVGVKARTESFTFDLLQVQAQLTKVKTAKAYLVENPANEKMKFPSRRTLLAEIHFK